MNTVSLSISDSQPEQIIVHLHVSCNDKTVNCSNSVFKVLKLRTGRPAGWLQYTRSSFFPIGRRPFFRATYI